MKAQSCTIHHSIHQHTSINPNMWVTSFPKGDYRSQRIKDSEATHTWEMRFHKHTQNHSKFSSITFAT